MQIEITTLQASPDVRLTDRTDSGGNPQFHVVLSFGDSEVGAWPLTEEEEEFYNNQYGEGKRGFIEDYVAKKLRAALGLGER